MVREGVRGFVRRSLPVLLSLLLTGPFGAAAVVPASSFAPPAPVVAVAQVEQPSAQEPPAPVAPEDQPAATVVVAGAPQVLHPQAVAGVRGSRAPPSTRA
ncbi:hypothetical protein [Symbioplanes lichenis]|uniref:hypothetical protein n=1 Tax=Symbioplanes lichenis TaxID=1629072 RepID=UPI0027397039|nr:hypothetical protein [Actinoplanes lichenis]